MRKRWGCMREVNCSDVYHNGETTKTVDSIHCLSERARSEQKFTHMEVCSWIAQHHKAMCMNNTVIMQTVGSSRSCIQERTWHFLPAWKLLQERKRILGSQKKCQLHVHCWGHTGHNPILHLGSHQEFAVEMTKLKIQIQYKNWAQCHGLIVLWGKNPFTACITIPALFQIWLMQKMYRHHTEISISGWFVQPPSCSAYGLPFHPLKEAKIHLKWSHFSGILCGLVFACMHCVLSKVRLAPGRFICTLKVSYWWFFWLAHGGTLMCYWR